MEWHWGGRHFLNYTCWPLISGSPALVCTPQSSFVVPCPQCCHPLAPALVHAPYCTHHWCCCGCCSHCCHCRIVYAHIPCPCRWCCCCCSCSSVAASPVAAAHMRTLSLLPLHIHTLPLTGPSVCMCPPCVCLSSVCSTLPVIAKLVFFKTELYLPLQLRLKIPIEQMNS